MKNGLQEPVSLTIPSVRTLDKLSDEIGKKMMFGSIVTVFLTDALVAQGMVCLLYTSCTTICLIKFDSSTTHTRQGISEQRTEEHISLTCMKDVYKRQLENRTLNIQYSTL